MNVSIKSDTVYSQTLCEYKSFEMCLVKVGSCLVQFLDFMFDECFYKNKTRCNVKHFVNLKPLTCVW